MNTELWTQFKMPEGLHPTGSGIMYFLRYSKERIEGHRDQVIKSLEDRGVYLENFDDSIEVMNGFNYDNGNVLMHLCEELSALNEAEEYRREFGNENTLSGITNQLKQKTWRMLDEGDDDGAYRILKGRIPSIAEEIVAAKTYTFNEWHEMISLIAFAEQESIKLNSPGIEVEY